MELYEDYGFAKAWHLVDGTYLLTFYNGQTKEFNKKRLLQDYIRRTKKKLEGRSNAS